jgi:hypothetical protein
MSKQDGERVLEDSVWNEFPLIVKLMLLLKHTTLSCKIFTQHVTPTLRDRNHFAEEPPRRENGGESSAKSKYPTL